MFLLEVMRKILVSLFFVCVAGVSYAQQTVVEKYAYAPAEYQNVFLDYVEKNPSKIISTSNGQYVGQVDENNMLCGYGMFVNNDGSQIFGQFNKGKLVFGITMLGTDVRVGSPDYYVNYSMTSGYMEYVYRANSKQILDGQGLFEYAFVSMRYSNGDQYVGEIYKHRRHGYGIYYYANGDIWFGEYNNDVRAGYGVLFSGDQNHLTIGCWDGEDVRREIKIKSSKK